MKRTVILFLFFLGVVSAPAAEMSFEHFGAARGMAQTAINSIVQDSSGNIWSIGDGKIFRYDGFECDSYETATSVRCLTADNSGRIWALCSGSLMFFDAEKGVFCVKEDGPEWQKGRYFGMRAMSSGKLVFFNGGHGLSYYDSRSGTLECICDTDSRVTAVYESDSGIWFGCADGGIYLLDSDSTEPVLLLKTDSPVSSLLLDGSGAIWAGTRGDGLYKYSQEGQERYSRGSGNLSSSVVLSLGMDTRGRIWAGSLVGLNVIDPVTGKTNKYFKDPFDDSSLSHNTVRYIFRDRQGGMWLGTYFGGINYWHPFRNRFSHIKPDTGDNSINDDVISCIVEDDEGLVWVGTNMGGVNCYNPSDGSFRHFFVSGRDGSSPEYNDVKSILCEKDKVLVGAYGAGLRIIDCHSGEVSNCSEWSSVYALDRAGNLGWWIGATNGLFLLEKDFRSSKQYASGRVVFLYHDSHGRYRACYADRTELFASDSLEDNIATGPLAGLQGVCDIFESSDGSFWLSSPSGLWKYNSAAESLSRCGTFGDSSIYGVEEDDAGLMWVATSFGLCRYNPATGDSRTFTSEDGMVVSLFQEYSHCRMSSGRMMFGGIGGIDIFDPAEMAPDSLCPVPVVNAIYINGKQITPSDSTRVLDTDIRVANSLRLRHDHNHVMFRFSAPDYDCGKQTRFFYRLQRFDRDWQETGKDRTATYSNLPKGKYLLQVKALNPDGASSPSCRELRIRVLPPWYRCDAAMVLWTLLFLTALFFSVRAALRHQQMANELKLRKLEKEHQREISRMKVLKFINSGALAAEGPSGRKVVTEIEAADEHFMLEVMGLVEGNISNPQFNTEMLAGKMNMSRTAVYMRVKRITGASPLDLIRKIRFTSACSLLDEGKLTVAEVAYKTGSRSPSAFIAAFKKYVGCTPMEYVRNGRMGS